MHAAACVAVLGLGFDHVSDDDFARVTIAQAFAHAPRLDPSGTSWLPFPFWMLGSAMLVFGRSLAAARVTSVALASVAATVPYVALRVTGAPRANALVALGFAMLSPWSLWLGAATVPESFTASFTAAAAIALGCGAAPAGAAAPVRGAAPVGLAPRVRLAFALALLAACLSRYEAWPVAAVLAVTLAVRGLRARKTGLAVGKTDLALAAVASVGPLLWMAWNQHAHGDPLHFFERVARFKRALGEGSPDTLDAILLYPRLFVTRRPDVVLALACVAAGALAFVRSRADVRRRWLVPLGCAAAQLAFLAYGNVRDGAPAHHAERALLGVMFLAAMLAGDVLVDAAPAALARARAATLAALALVGLAWLGNGAAASLEVPGRGATEDRRAQIAAGAALREAKVEHLELTPCAYEQFALVAAFGAPERVVTNPRTNAAVTASCPVVDRR